MFGRPPITTRNYNVQKILRAKQRGLEAAWILARGQKKHITEALHDGQWRSQPCFILGGGPSLTGFKFDRLRGRRTIAINRAFEYAPFAEILFSMDSTFYQWVLKYRGGAFFAFPGIRVFLDSLNFPYGAEVHYIRNAGVQGFPKSLTTGIYSANNSGYGALQIAICLGAQPIYLLGFDMNNSAHFHNGYPGKFSAPVNKSFKQGYEALAPALRQKGIRVVNLNPGSHLRCFEFGNLEEVLNDNHQPARKPAPAEATTAADAGTASQNAGA
jgi:hypothetical protein